MPRCSICKEVKSHGDFDLIKSGDVVQLRSRCKECRKKNKPLVIYKALRKCSRCERLYKAKVKNKKDEINPGGNPKLLFCKDCKTHFARMKNKIREIRDEAILKRQSQATMSQNKPNKN